jgi:hypothetical protein
VGYEGELQLSQFDIKRTLYRNLNYTRSESSRSPLLASRVAGVLKEPTTYRYRTYMAAEEQ